MNGDALGLLREPRGEGVRGIRPPAAFVEKMLEWDLTGVRTTVVAIEGDVDGYDIVREGERKFREWD